MENQDLLHEIDKRLAVIEAMSTQHGRQTEEQFEHLEEKLEQMQKELSNLKFKIGGIASAVSAFIAVGAHWWGR